MNSALGTHSSVHRGIVGIVFGLCVSGPLSHTCFRPPFSTPFSFQEFLTKRRDLSTRTTTTFLIGSISIVITIVLEIGKKGYQTGDLPIALPVDQIRHWHLSTQMETVFSRSLLAPSLSVPLSLLIFLLISLHPPSSSLD